VFNYVRFINDRNDLDIRRSKMPKLNRPVEHSDLEDKGFPFQCENCGNKPTPSEVVEHNGSCAICGDSVIAYTVDTAEYIINSEKPKWATFDDFANSWEETHKEGLEHGFGWEDVWEAARK
jgi:hypothetical protein